MKLPQSTVEQQAGNVKMGASNRCISQPQTDNIININFNRNIIDINDINNVNIGGDIGNVSAPRESLGLEPEILTPGQIDMSNVSEADVPAEERVLPKDLEGGDPTFSFAKLDEITSGDFNVGELKINADGSLDKINNHVRGFRWKNKVKLTPEQNLEVRKQTWKCLEMTCKDPDRLNEFPGRMKLETVKKLLLNERDRTVALSRDEVHFLIAMLKTGNPASPYTAANFKKLHEFKIGKEANAREVQTFIKGLAEGNSDTQKRVARSVSANAQQSIVSFVLNEIKNFFHGLFGGRTFVRCDKVESGLKNEFGSTGNLKKRENYDVFAKNSLDVVLESVARKYQLPENMRLERNVPIRNQDNDDPNHFHVNVKREVCNLVQREISDQVYGLNPYRVLEGNGSVRMRQTPGSRVYGVVSMINAVCQSGDENAIRILKERFTEDGCTLLDKDGNPVVYKYENFLAGDNNLSPFERIVEQHVENCNMSYTSDVLGDVYDILGFDGREVHNTYDSDSVVDEEVAAAKGEKFVNELSKVQFSKGRNIVCASLGSLTHPTEGEDEWHYYSLRLPESDAMRNMVFEGDRPVGVRVHVISSRPDGPNGEYEFDHVLRFVDVQRMSIGWKLKFMSIAPSLGKGFVENKPSKVYSVDSPKRAESLKRAEKRQSVLHVEGGAFAKKLDLAKLVTSMQTTGKGMYERVMNLIKSKEGEKYEKVDLAAKLYNAMEVRAFWKDLKESDVIWLLKDYAEAKKIPDCKVVVDDKGVYSTNLDFDETKFVEWAIQWFASVSLRDDERKTTGARWRSKAKDIVTEYSASKDTVREPSEEEVGLTDKGSETAE